MNSKFRSSEALRCDCAFPVGGITEAGGQYVISQVGGHAGKLENGLSCYQTDIGFYPEKHEMSSEI